MAIPVLPFGDLNLTADMLFSGPTGLVVLLAIATLAGVIAGKMHSDVAKAKKEELAKVGAAQLSNEDLAIVTQENVTKTDWIEDAGYGLIGGMVGIAIIKAKLMQLDLPIESLPAFGFFSRELLYNLKDKFKLK